MIKYDGIHLFVAEMCSIILQYTKLAIRKILLYSAAFLVWLYDTYNAFVLYCKEFQWTQKKFWKAVGIFTILFLFFVNIIKYGSIWQALIAMGVLFLSAIGLGILLLLAIIYADTLPKDETYDR